MRPTVIEVLVLQPRPDLAQLLTVFFGIPSGWARCRSRQTGVAVIHDHRDICCEIAGGEWWWRVALGRGRLSWAVQHD